MYGDPQDRGWQAPAPVGLGGAPQGQRARPRTRNRQHVAGYFGHIYLLFHSGLLTPDRGFHEPLSPGMRCWLTFVASETTVKSFRCIVCQVEFRFEIGYSRWAVMCWMDFGTETEPVQHLDKWKIPLNWRDNNVLDATRPVPSEASPMKPCLTAGPVAWRKKVEVST